MLIDGQDIREVPTAALHRQLGIVLQQNFLFSGTVAENVRFSRPDASDAEVAAAFERLDCRDLIDALPHGLATEVGECGRNLSLGQRQLFALPARCWPTPRSSCSMKPPARSTW